MPAAIAECQRAGIRVAMITGDHALTARAIASDIGLLGPGSERPPGAEATSAARVIDGAELEAMSAQELDAAVEDTRVYARVNPEHKLRIVDALKRRGEIVAMTGDGVNDAPALKRADIGVAMGRVGTDVARDASDLVLADDDFATIVHAVELGRVVFDNLRKVILFLLSCNMSEVLVVFLTALISPTAALLPLQLLWINLITDGLPALALGVDPREPGVMDRPPRDANESILSARRQLQIAWQGLVMTAAVPRPLLRRRTGDPGHQRRCSTHDALQRRSCCHSFCTRSTSAAPRRPSGIPSRCATDGSCWRFSGRCCCMPLSSTRRHSQGIFKTAPLSPAQWLAVAGAAMLGSRRHGPFKLLAARARRRSAEGSAE